MTPTQRRTPRPRSDVRRLIETARGDGRLIETHASWVLLGDHLVYKMKKPVDFGFLDFSTPEKRKRACDAELSLNARLAEDVYLAVVPIREGGSGVYIDDAQGPWSSSAASPEDDVIDWAVKMRRLRDEDRADLLLARGELSETRVEQLAELLARFHDRSDTSERIREFGSSEVIRGNVRENFDQMRALSSDYLDPVAEQRIEQHQLGFIEDHRDLLHARASAGKVRDGHGDLRLEHVYFEKRGVSVIDCIEFNERFRFADVASDLAFLVMDLRHQGSDRLAELFAGQYARASGDFEIYRLLDFYESYRAYVRGKVTALLDREKHDPILRKKARDYFLHAGSVQERPSNPPIVIAVGGLIASGKSTLCQKLTRQLGAPVIDTDRVRKRLAGLDVLATSADAPFEGLYSPEMTSRVYSAVFEQAEWVLCAGRSAIVEGSFSSEGQRSKLLSLCRDLGVDVAFIWCWVPREVALARLEERARSPSVSDGRLQIYDELVERAEPPRPGELERMITLDTSGPEEESAAELSRLGLDDERQVRRGNPWLAR